MLFRSERQAYSDLMNFHLERAGRAERLHPAQLKERGFDREPEPRVDPSDSNKARYQGIITEKWAEVMLSMLGTLMLALAWWPVVVLQAGLYTLAKRLTAWDPLWMGILGRYLSYATRYEG